MQDYAHITVEKASRNCGAFVSGVDLKRPLSEAVCREIHTALMRHQVVFFRDQDVTPQEQAAFARNFGPLRKARRAAFETRDDSPEVSVIVNDRERPPYIDHYHADGMFRAAPEFGSILKAEQPPEIGGDTIFVSLTAAWRGLSETMRAALQDKIAIYDFMRLHSSPEKARNWEGEARAGMIQTRDENPPVKHPLVPEHPVTGERCLYFSESFTSAILGLTKYESEALHALLTRHCAKPEFQYRLQWRKGTIAFWDNRSSLHYAVADYWPDTRIMHRLTIEKDTIGEARRGQAA
ncbi:MAG: TauD/TfdA family dioxygenase [Gammaproteobacteria bacterium]|nr:TauD/TfdA family dioxygenase [Gammaproteobacteria bacterium]